MTNNLSMTAKLAVNLIQIHSITPNDLGCIDLIIEHLKPLGFKCLILKDSGTTNLLATHGTYDKDNTLFFLGHTDVVPPQDEASWIHNPFSADIEKVGNDLVLHGRGAQDMKGSDAAMTCALADFVKENPNHKGMVGIILTSNEEGDAKGGTPFVVSYLKDNNLIPTFCIVGEPSCSNNVGDTIKNGRRGSFTAHITVKGVQGHVAYPQMCDNAAHSAAKLISALSNTLWDDGTEFFPKTSFEVTNIKCGTGAENVVSGTCYIMCNWRFNNLQDATTLSQKLEKIASDLNVKIETRYVLNGMPFITQGGALLECLSKAIFDNTKITPSLSTSGGTSDGRFVAPLGTKVVEFGTTNNLIHKVNEKVEIKQLDLLHDIFKDTLTNIFK